MRQRRLHHGVQALRVDALHELEPLEGRVGHRRPVYRARVVHQHVEPAVRLFVFLRPSAPRAGGRREAGRLTETASETSLFTLSSNRTSTCRASASPPAVVISRATVVMVLSGELGSGGKGTFLDASLVDLAATTTG